MQMRTKEFAAALGVSPDTIRRLERRGVITASRDWAGHRRFSEAELSRVRARLFPLPLRRPQSPAARPPLP